MAIAAAPRYSVPSIRAPRTVTLETHALVGRLIDWQILAGYAADAMGAANCPENAGAVDVARQALFQLQEGLRAEAGRVEGLES